MSIRLITFACAILSLAFAAAFVKNAQGPQGLVLDTHGRPQLTDHLSLWSAGRLAAQGRPAAAYDWTAHEAAMADVMGRQPPSKLQFSYPPTALLVFAPLSHLPFTVSLVLFGLLTLAPLAFLSARIIGRPEAAIWMLATVPPFWNFSVGQTGALAAALLGAGLLLLPRKPLLAGALFGLLTFKPHLGLLVPVALLVSGQWRAIAAAAATTAAVALLSLAVHGLEPWHVFAVSLKEFGAFAMADTNATAYKLQSIFGLLRTLGLPTQAALVAQIALALAAASLTWHLWRKPGSHDLKAGVLLASAVLVTPYVFHYDLTMLTLAQAFLLRHVIGALPADATDLPVRDIIAILAVNALIIAFPPLSFPTGVLASLLLLAILLHRLLIEAPHLLPLPSTVRSPRPATT